MGTDPFFLAVFSCSFSDSKEKGVCPHLNPNSTLGNWYKLT